MSLFIQVLNPFQPSERKETRETSPVSVRGWLLKTWPGFREFETPTVCFFNGQPLLRKDWGRVATEGDIVAFVAMPGAMVPIWVWYLVAVVIGLGIGMLMPKPSYEQIKGDSVYSIRGQQNKIRLGEPVEVAYGRCRLWPSYASVPYNRYIGNDQWQFALFCLGQGSYQIHEVQIEDTPIGNYKDVEYAIYEPGQPVTLFDDNVSSSSEVANVELLGTNEAGAGWVGPFVTNGLGTQTQKLEVDFVMPAGLYGMSSKGKIQPATVSVEAQYRAAGSTVDVWLPLVTQTWTLSTATAQRFTFSVPVSLGRWEVRARRSNAKDANISSPNLIHWGALRAFLPSTKNYGNKTMLAVKMRATNNLNDQSAYRFNVWATRKVPVWDKVNQQWLPETATRSIVWALFDIFKGQYGGQLTDSYMALDELADMDSVYETEGRKFDYIFDQKSTVWEAAKVVARVGRAVPMLEGSLVRMIKDQPKSLPVALFGPQNMLEGSFKWNISLPKDNDYDGVRIEYTDPGDFLPKTVDCLVTDDAGENCEEIKLLGCTDRNWAWREGYYIRACKKFIRQSAVFSTGLEGHIPQFGALIGVSHDLPMWSQSGVLLSVATDRRTLTLSEPVNVSGAGAHYIGFKTKSGDSTEPLLCTGNGNTVVLAADLPESVFLSASTEPPLFHFGPGGEWSKKCVLRSMTPGNGESLEIEAHVYDGRVFERDGDFAPGEDPFTPPFPPVPDIPEMECSGVTFLIFKGVTGGIGSLSWPASLGATKYEVEVQENGIWTSKGVTESTSMVLSSLTVPHATGTFQARVRPIGRGIGEWCSAEYTLTDEDTNPPKSEEVLAGLYCDLINIPEDLPGGLLFSSIDVHGVVLGLEEYVPSTPPKRYRTATVSGANGQIQNYAFNDPCEGTEPDAMWKSGVSMTGTITVDNSQGEQQWTHTGALAFSVSNWGCGYGEVITNTWEANAGTAILVPFGYDGAAVSGTTYAIISYNTCWQAACGSYVNKNMQTLGGGWTINLSNEFTEDDAVNRSINLYNLTWSAWSEAANVAAWYARTTGFEVHKLRTKFKGFWTNGLPFWVYVVKVHTQTRAYGSNDPWEDGQTYEWNTLATNLAGDVEIEETELPCERGKEARVEWWSISGGC